MNKKQLAELLKYSSPNIIYVVTWNNILKKVICPFKVRVKNDIGELFKNQIVWVEQVKVTPEIKTIYIIDGNAYYYFYFEILIR
jgi:hypothetical protein